MKSKIFAALALLLILSASSLAQESYAISRGSVILGGTAGISSYGDDKSKDRDTDIQINTSVSYFFVSHLAAGGTFNLNRHRSLDRTSPVSYGIGPTIGYYFGNQSSKAFPYLSSSLLWVGQSNLYSSRTWRFASGFALMIAKNVAITNEAFYSTSTINNEEGFLSKNNIFGLQFGFGVLLF